MLGVGNDKAFPSPGGVTGLLPPPVGVKGGAFNPTGVVMDVPIPPPELPKAPPAAGLAAPPPSSRSGSSRL